jgi:hypothetical protein
MRHYGVGNVALVLVSGYPMLPSGARHGVIAFGGDGRYLLVPAGRDDHGMAAATEAYAVPATAFARMTRSGRDRLSAALVIRKGIQ